MPRCVEKSGAVHQVMDFGPETPLSGKSAHVLLLFERAEEIGECPEVCRNAQNGNRAGRLNLEFRTEEEHGLWLKLLT